MKFQKLKRIRILKAENYKFKAFTVHERENIRLQGNPPALNMRDVTQFALGVYQFHSERKSGVMHPSVLCAQTKWRRTRISDGKVGKRKLPGSGTYE